MEVSMRGGDSVRLSQYDQLICAVVRNSFGYACIVDKPIRITNIRAHRKKPGLKNQNVVNLQILTRLTGGEIISGHEGSLEVVFRPGSQRIGNEQFFLDQTSGFTFYLLYEAEP